MQAKMALHTVSLGLLVVSLMHPLVARSQPQEPANEGTEEFALELPMPIFEWDADGWDVVLGPADTFGNATVGSAFGISANNGQITDIFSVQPFLKASASVNEHFDQDSIASTRVSAIRRFRLANAPFGWQVSLVGRLLGLLNTTDTLVGTLNPRASVNVFAVLRKPGVAPNLLSIGVSESREDGDDVPVPISRQSSRVLADGEYEVRTDLNVSARVDGALLKNGDATADFFTRIDVDPRGNPLPQPIQNGWSLRVIATPRSPGDATVSATAVGSKHPPVVPGPNTKVTNGDFLITELGGPGSKGAGDGFDEETTWTFDFGKDPDFQFFSFALPLASAILTLELTPTGDIPQNDAFRLIVPVKPSVPIKELLFLPKNVPNTINIDLAKFYTSREMLFDPFIITPGKLRVSFADDSIVSSAKLTLTPFSGQNVNDKFPELHLEDTTRTFDARPCAIGASAGTFTVKAEFENISLDTLSNLFFEVETLTNGNVLCNADAGPGGVRLTVPLADVLEPHESFTAEFKIGLANMDRFFFFVNLFGIVQQ